MSRNILLAIETSSPRGSAAVIENGRLLAEMEFPGTLRHEARLFPAIERMFRDLGIVPADIRMVAAGIGPGSYTGLRIGVMAAKTIAWSVGADLIGVSSFDALAEELTPEGGLFAPVLDARQNHLYGCLYARTTEGVTRKSDYLVLPAGELRERLPAGTLLAGDGILRHPGVFDTERYRWHPGPPPAPRAAVVGRLAATRHAAGEKTDPKTLLPLYLRPPQVTQRKKR
ncbi:MAG: tRNA (adenosine(37)-N6)-threonylcarbamoyltransferase complex dimerization subunit type 1 TsaB [Planctomycetota bacterium]